MSCYLATNKINIPTNKHSNKLTNTGHKPVEFTIYLLKTMITRLNLTQHVTFVVHFEIAKTLMQSYMQKYTYLFYIVVPLIMSVLLHFNLDSLLPSSGYYWSNTWREIIMNVCSRVFCPSGSQNITISQ